MENSLSTSSFFRLSFHLQTSYISNIDDPVKISTSKVIWSKDWVDFHNIFNHSFSKNRHINQVYTYIVSNIHRKVRLDIEKKGINKTHFQNTFVKIQGQII